MLRGKIVRGVGGFYSVDAGASGVFECRARGIFRLEKQKPLVGDDVEMEILDETAREGSLVRIFPRKNCLIRPACANVDQAIVIFAARQPDPNLQLLDRFLISMERQKIPAVICFNKIDLADDGENGELLAAYRGCGYPVLGVSAKSGAGIDDFLRLLEGKTSVVAGPSGVGKSSLVNCAQTQVSMQTGEISRKLKRGKHTTRHAQLITVGEGTYLCDTPGFSSLFLGDLEKEELAACFPEFAAWEPRCRFQGCAHIHEPDCGVREAVADGKISRSRYDHYVLFYEELRSRKRSYG